MDSAHVKSVKGSIFIVDDDRSGGQTLSALMEGEGYEVRCAPSGQTALLFAREEPPELILLDVRLPDVDGFEVCRRLKESAGTCGIPVIFLSALEDAKDKVKGFAVGGADYITKPFHAEEVLARVRTHVALYRLQSDLGRRVEEQTATLRVANTQLAQNIEALNRSEEALKERLRFETLLTFFIYFAPGATYAPHQLPKPLSPSTRASSTNFNDAQAKDRHLTQYFEIFGNRTIYHDGWLAGTVHGAAWEYKPRASLENDTWELYDARTDFALANDLAAKNPEKLKEMQDLFTKEAVKYNVLPLDDRSLERLNPAMVGRPDLMAGRTSLTVYEGMTGMSENVFINVKNRSHTITAEVTIPKGGGKGVILAHAGRFGGWSLYLKNGKPSYAYNFLGLKRFTIAAKQAVPVGKATIRCEFAYDGGGFGKGGMGTIFVNGKNVAEGRIDHTQPIMFSGDEGADVGEDGETPVTEDYGIPAPYRFTGKIDKVTIDLN